MDEPTSPRLTRLHVTEWPGDAHVPGGCSIGIDDEFGAEGGRDYYLFTAVHGDSETLAEHARRMVACWNAFYGVETSTIERMVAERGSAPAPEPELEHYVALYREEGADPLAIPLAFTCQAEDGDHAQEQCENAYPGCEVLWTYLGTNVDAAYDNYYNP